MRKLFTLLLCLGIGTWLQGQVNTFPVFEDFESAPTGPTGCGPTYTFSTGIWNNGDNAIPASAGHDVDWTVNTGGTSSSSTGPSIDHTLGSSAGHYTYTETSCSGTGYSFMDFHLVSDYLDFSALTDPTIDFWYHMYGQSMGNLYVDVDTSQGASAWVTVWGPTTDNIDVWQNGTASLAVAAGMDSVRIRFRSVSGNNFYSDMALDDILIFQPIPENLEATNYQGILGGCGLTTEDVIYDIVNVGTDTIHAGDTIYASYDLNGGAPYTDTIVVATDLAPGDTLTHTFGMMADYSVPGLYDLTIYQTVMGDSAYGNDTLTEQINSIPVNVVGTFFEEDFESGQNGWTITNGSSGTWAFGTPAQLVIQGASSGVNAFGTGNLNGLYNANESGYVEGPCFDMSNMCDPWVAIDVWWEAEFSWDGANLFGSSDGGSTWQLVGNFNDPYNWYTDNSINGTPGGSQEGWTGRNGSGSPGWVTAHHSLEAFNNPSDMLFRVHFGSDGSVQDDGFAFDNFRLYDVIWWQDDAVLGCDSTTLDARGSTGATYLWSTGETTQTITVDSSGWYTVTVTPDSGCTGTESIYVGIQDASTEHFAMDTMEVCAVDSFMLCPTYLPSTTYFWSTGDTISNGVMSPMMMNECVWLSSSQEITLMTVNSCDTIWDTVYVELIPAPAVELGPDTTQCGGSVTLDAGSNGTSYLWNTTETTQTITVTSSGTYVVAVTDSATGCTTWDSLMVTINAIPNPDLGADQAICSGDTACLMPMVVDSNCTYMWSTGATGSTLCVTSAGTYIVVCTDQNGCMGADTIEVTLAPDPTASFTESPNGLTVAFTDASTNATSWSWDFGDGNTSTTQNPSHTYAADGTYTVTLTVTNGCGSDTFTSTITVVGISELAGVSVSVFPNPNDGSFTVELDGLNSHDASLEVTNLYGQIVLSRKLNNSGSLVREQVNLTHVAAGVYLVRIRTNEGMLVRRVTVK